MENLKNYSNWLQSKGLAKGTIEQYLIYLRITPQEKRLREEYLSQNIRNRNLIAAYRSYLDYLEYNDIISSEENYKLKKHYQLPKKHGKTRKGVAVESKNWPELIKAGSHAQARLAIFLGLKCGLRPSETRHLRVKDIDFEFKEIKIREHREDKQTGQVEWFPKYFKERDVPFDDDVFETLVDWLRNIRPENLGHPYLLWNPDARAKPGVISDVAFWRWIKKSGVNGHDLRRSCLTDALYRTNNPRVAQLIAGHSSLNTTSNYIRSDKKRAFDMFRNMT